MINSNTLLLGHAHKIQTMQKSPETPSIPIRVIYTPLSQSPSKNFMTLDQLQRAFGFRNVSSFLHETKSTSQNLTILNPNKGPIVDIGNVSTISKKSRNTSFLNLPRNLGDTMHIDIIYGSSTAIQVIKYALFVVDRATH